MTNPLYFAFAQFAGISITSNTSAPGQRLSFARGVLQVFSSLLTATGIASFLTLATHTGGTLAWSLPLWIGCAAAVLCFDTVFNIVLNLTSGYAFYTLVTVRVALTVIVAQFAAQNLTLLWNQNGIKPIAEKLATAEFDASLSTIKGERDAADKSLAESRKTLTDFEREVNGNVKSADIPAGCTTPGNTTSEDPATQARLQRAERQRLDRCNKVFAQNLQSDNKRQEGQDKLRAALQEAVTKSEDRVNKTQQAYDAKNEARGASVAELATNVSIQASALETLKVKSLGTRLLHWGLLFSIGIIELLSVFIKVVTANIDESSLADRDTIETAANNSANGIYNNGLMRNARRATPPTEVVQAAEDSFKSQVRGTMAASNAERMARARQRQLRGELRGMAAGDD